MDEALLKAIQQRADELWQAAGSPDGYELAYRLQAEQEIANTSVAGEEDSLSCVEVDDYRGYSAEDALRRGVEDAVAEPESLASGADENPISERIREEADCQTPPPSLVDLARRR